LLRKREVNDDSERATKGRKGEIHEAAKGDTNKPRPNERGLGLSRGSR